MKFRAFDPTTGKMYFSPNEHIYLNIDGTCHNFQNGEVLELMLAIGLPDKTDKEIYCGDIIRFYCSDLKEFRLGVVKHAKKGAYLYIGTKNKHGVGIAITSTHQWYYNDEDEETICEILGNVKQHKIEDFV